MQRAMSRQPAAGKAHHPASASPALAALAPVVRAFLQAHAIGTDALRSEGRVVLVIDGRSRVHLMPAPHDRVALQAELLALPGRQELRDDVLTRLARAACGLLQQHASTLCIDSRRQALVLQQTLDADAEVAQLEEALAEFANALAFWQRVCERERTPA